VLTTLLLPFIAVSKFCKIVEDATDPVTVVEYVISLIIIE
jgi:hypothetical protein